MFSYEKKRILTDRYRPHNLEKFRLILQNRNYLKKKNAVKLSAKEFELLRYFAEHQGNVISRDQLLDDIWGYDVTPTTRTVDNYILSLRKRIERDPSNPKHLITIHTAEYKFLK